MSTVGLGPEYCRRLETRGGWLCLAASLVGIDYDQLQQDLNLAVPRERSQAGRRLHERRSAEPFRGGGSLSCCARPKWRSRVIRALPECSVRATRAENRALLHARDARPLSELLSALPY